MQAALLLAIIASGAILRFYGLNWDEGHLLHPDERFLQMVSHRLKLPESLLQHLDPAESPLNPYHTTSFFVYGIFPLLVLELAELWLGEKAFGGLLLLSRNISAAVDTGTILLTYFLARELRLRLRLPQWIETTAALLYAIAVLPIQHAHFFTTDAMLTMLICAALLGALRYQRKGSRAALLGSAVSFGLALACKVSAVLLLPLLAALIVFDDWTQLRALPLVRRSFRRLPQLLVFAAFAYTALRFGDPRMFADANFLLPRLNPQFLANVKELQSFASYETYFPPAIQWQSTQPVVFAARNLFFYGLGPPYGLLLLIGAACCGLIRTPSSRLVLLWALCIFLYQSCTFVKTMRYFLYLYPLFAVLAAVGLWQMLRPLCSQRARALAATGCLLLCAIWPASFMRIYARPHSRIQASTWIYRNVPDGAYLTFEHWDDALPVSRPGYDKKFNSLELPVFAPDNEEKWAQMEERLAKADYVILSSNRGYGSIMKVPEKYPRMSRFYDDLFAGRLNFTKVAEVSSYPGIVLPFLKLEFNDQGADEAFTVYDHPLVTIFQRRPPQEQPAPAAPNS